MLKRFQTCRWSPTRKKIHRLPLGGRATFPRAQYCNAAITDRFNAMLTKLQKPK